MTITLKNVDFELLNVLESLQGLKKDLEIIKYPNDETLEAMKECEEIERDIKNGTRKPFASWEEAREALLKD
ncbi:hypothetical protein CQA53_08690 [Helicobacter didelphidarum]|uniref:Uncharacterized protein n=1 Tax=Helicobacter didelphidarum TaxID=2040648 RepID=A0A3D8IF87_9HELI|nr:hypothetical protein [Helicobacter didelphidarum]RDU63211.1 hypothetical protein CQA53_08690 [Helicobacter didelphidarum]